MNFFNQYKVLFFVGLLSAIVLYGCERDEQMWSSESYVKTNVGHYRIYDVSETKYAASVSPVVTVFQEMHKISSVKLLTASDVSMIEVSVFRRNDEQNLWKEVEGYTMINSQENLLITNQGITRMVLKYPVVFGDEWNGNAYNMENEELYKVQRANQMIERVNIDSDHLIKVIRREKSTLIDYYNSVQYFAPNIGLVYDEDTALEYCQDNNCIGSDKIDSGYEKKMVLISYGLEP